MRAENLPSKRPEEAILLVAGTGTRLLPLTADKPKCLIEVAGKSLLERQLRQLQAAGIRRVVFATGYLKDHLMEAANSWGLEMELVFAPGETYATENNAVSLGVAMKKLRSRHFLFCDGDILMRDEKLIAALLDDPQENVLSIIRFEEMGEEEMKVDLAEGRKIRHLSKEIDPKTADGESLGVQKIGPSAFEKLQNYLDNMTPDERRRLYYEDVFSLLIDQGIPFYAREFQEGTWFEIDTVEDLQVARQLASTWETKEVLA